MKEFRRRHDTGRWHWCKECPDYPTEPDAIISYTVPEYGALCEECMKREPLEEKEKGLSGSKA